MKKAAAISIFVLLLVIGSLAFFMNRLQNELDLYKNGFSVTGTYETIKTDDERDYLVFAHDEKDTFEYVSYQQFGKLKAGTYKKTANPNLFLLEETKTKEKSFIIVGKDALFLVKENQEIKEFKKIANEGVYLNVDTPDNDN